MTASILQQFYAQFDKHGRNTIAVLSESTTQLHSLMTGRRLVGATLIGAALDCAAHNFDSFAYVSPKKALDSGFVLSDAAPILAPNLAMMSNSIASHGSVIKLSAVVSQRNIEHIPFSVYRAASWLRHPPQKPRLNLDKAYVLAAAFNYAEQTIKMLPEAFRAALGSQFLECVGDMGLLMLSLQYQLKEPLTGYCAADSYRALCERNPDAFYYACHCAAIVADAIANEQIKKAA
jgi:hypothetical protein